MNIEMTLRAGIQIHHIDGELKQWVTECLATLKAGNELPATPMSGLPGTFVAKFKDYRLIFKRQGNLIEVQDILVFDPELRQQLRELAADKQNNPEAYQ